MDKPEIPIEEGNDLCGQQAVKGQLVTQIVLALYRSHRRPIRVG